mmetsp:Transcript_9993/g.42491  ORF Transcript_9993/g.42491 Transcript_9993/m.42491 type:complete len:223 (-) Transcript_9993:819-1487(-)
MTSPRTAKTRFFVETSETAVEGLLPVVLPDAEYAETTPSFSSRVFGAFGRVWSRSAASAARHAAASAASARSRSSPTFFLLCSASAASATRTSAYVILNPRALQKRCTTRNFSKTRMIRTSPRKRTTAWKSRTTASTASRTELTRMSSWNSSSSMSFCRKSLFSVSSTNVSLSSSAGKAAGGTPEPNAARLAAGTEAHPRAVLSFASEESDAKGTVFRSASP